MKLVGIVGSNAEVSYNRKLMEFIAKEYKDLFTLELLDITNLPMFNQDEDHSKENKDLIVMNRKILQSDGVIIATPEHNHTITASLKSALEWLSFELHPFENKPVMVVGASYYDQGSSRAQLHLRQVLDAPGVNAIVFPGNEFLLGKAKEAFDENGNIKDERTIGYLRICLTKFAKFATVAKSLAERKPTPPEDLTASGKISTTIEGVEGNDDDWYEKAAEKVNAVSGDTYVKLDRGILTVDQLNCFLNSMPIELTYADSNNQFLYYNYNKEEHEMLAKRRPEQVGCSLSAVHPERVHGSVSWLVGLLRSGQIDVFRTHVPTHGPDKYVVHNYQAMYDKDGKYAGINEYILDFKPIVDWYLKQTGQTLVKNGMAMSGGYAQAPAADATSGASGGGHSHGAPAATPAADATSGASA
ncbi:MULTISPECIES: NAD(P)H-dependent oxidoreductase [Gemella]|uniref:NAD(P)H-dependent oxidoreductase n=1 Tax=Gemella TaxID=1378 RepID=UPI000767FD98|nr:MULTISPECIES: NAD(P)H-dependent oxidoreductase [Gemella]AME08993.1 NADPH-dependent FMN reductase [Gemella sp. oral taxon 928]